MLNRARSLPLWTLILFLLLLVIGAGEKWFAAVRERGSYPPEGVTWIWNSKAKAKPPMPVSFITYRDFSLEALPSDAEIIATADEEMLLFLNGRVVGGVRNTPGYIDQVQRVEVTELLRRGGNRLSVELRSSRGVGGFFLCLRVEGHCVVASDPHWVTVDRWVPGVHRGWWPTGSGDPVRRWFAAPVGRWDFDPPPETAVSWIHCMEGEFIKGKRLKGVEPAEGAPFGRQVYDFGSEMRGILRLRGAEKGNGLNLLRVGSRLADLAEWDENEVLPVIPLPGRKDWNSSEIIEGRFVELTGFPVKSAEFRPVVPSCGNQVRSKVEAESSSLDRGRSMAPMENEIRRRLESLASGAIGEGA